MADTHDIVVIGSGPGGYVCAIRAAQLGLKVAVVERRATHGGTCLNIGCIPSKALLHASELFHEAAHGLAGFGIRIGTPKLDLKAMMAHKADTVSANVKGIDFLFRKNGIDSHHGTGRIVAPGKVEVTPEKGSATILEAASIVIATGSDVARLPGIDIDEKRVVSSTGALSLTRVPGRLIVIGAGVIGLELGSVWRRLGSEVLVVEYLDRILPGMDLDTARTFQRSLKKQGMKFRLSSRLTAIDRKGRGLLATIEPATGDAAPETIEADVVLIAIGRVPYTEGLGLEEIGIARDERGRIETDGRFRTTVPGIYAIGDVIAGPMLAHKAAEEGVALAEQLAGQSGHVNYDAIPSVVYTRPELATVGRTEEELRKAGIAYSVGKFPFTANGRAKAMAMTDGFVKILADRKTDRVLGVHIIGADAGEMIHEVTLAMEFGASAEDIARTCHAHPTLSEAIREAALAVDKRSLHM